MKTKKGLSIILALMLMLSALTGCGNKPQPEPAPADNPSQAENPSQASTEDTGLTEKIELTFAHSQQGTSEPGMAMQAFADKVKEDSNGMIEITVYPGSQLGGERDEMEGLSMGTIDMAYISAGVIENYVPAAGIFNLPFIFDDYDHAQKVLSDETILGTLGEGLAANNINLLTCLVQGNRYMYSTKAVDMGDLSTLKGLKIRVPEAPMATGIWSSVGSNPTAVPWSEVYTAMSTKIVEAFEVHVYAVLMENLQETFDYAYLTNHQTSVSGVMISTKTWEGLPAAAQKIITDNLPYLIEVNAENIISAEEGQLQALRDAGIEVVEVTPEQKEAMKEACADLQNSWLSSTENAQELYDIVQSLR